MKRKRRLKKWVRVTLWGFLIIGLGGLFYLVLSIGSNNMNKMYENCDNAKGHICSYYEARQYMIKGE